MAHSQGGHQPHGHRDWRVRGGRAVPRICGLRFRPGIHTASAIGSDSVLSGVMEQDEAQAQVVEQETPEQHQEAAERAHPDAQWFVIHTYSGYENKVKTNLEHRIESM